MEPVFLEGFWEKPLIMYGKRDNVKCLLPEAEMEGIKDIAAYELRRVILPIPHRKYALVREGENGEGEYGEVYTFSELRRISKKQKEGKKIYALKKLDDLTSPSPDAIK